MGQLSNADRYPLKRIALVIQYLGTEFHGWQRQPHQRTVQAAIEDTLSGILGSSVVLHGAGRTDAGVHAAAQIAHFDEYSPIPAAQWMAILNDRLPQDIVIRGSIEVPTTWHARFSALWRRYRYTLYTDRHPNLFVRPLCWHYYSPRLEPQRMQAALNPLLGKHHLAAFHRAGSDRRHSWVEVQAAECYQRGSFIHLEIQANGFLYGMVRLLVGMLVEVGSGRRSLESFQAIWVNQQREEVKYSAPAQGLCLLRVGYADPIFPQETWFDTQPLFVLNV
jgi:tRNA pseudouridine38-40 synthase